MSCLGEDKGRWIRILLLWHSGEFDWGLVYEDGGTHYHLYHGPAMENPHWGLLRFYKGRLFYIEVQI